MGTREDFIFLPAQICLGPINLVEELQTGLSASYLCSGLDWGMSKRAWSARSSKSKGGMEGEKEGQSLSLL